MSFKSWLVEYVKNSSLRDTSSQLHAFHNVESFAVVSDVHLRNPWDSNTQIFLDSLDFIENQNPQYFILLGDIFDFISAGSNFFSQRWKVVFERIQKLHAKNIKVIFVEGNHDFGFEKSPTKIISSALNFATEGSLLLSLKGEHSFFLSHGDTIFCDQAYLSFRKLTKSNFAKFLSKMVPGRLLQWGCDRYAEHSRSRETPLLKSHYYSGIKNLSQRFAQLSPTYKNHIVFGHIHMYFDETSQENTSGFGSVHCGPSWYQAPSVFFCQSDLQNACQVKTKRLWWNNAEKNWQMQKPSLSQAEFEHLAVP